MRDNWFDPLWRHICCGKTIGRFTGQRSGMEKSSRLSKVFAYQSFGFLAIIALGYLDDLIRLPALVFSDHPFMFFFRRSTLEMLLILAVWLLVSTSTRRILDRLRYLEKFMRVCAWCRRIDSQGRWMPLDEFIRQGFDTPTTHGICPECLRQQKEAHQRAQAARKSSTASS